MSESNESQKPLDFDLRTRIAAAMYRHEHQASRSAWDGEDEHVHDYWRAAADAVIRELGNLRQEPHRFQCGSDDCIRYRIISDWTPNE